MTKGVGKIIIAPERTFERRRGCYSCKHFGTGEIATALWQDRRAADEVHVAMSSGNTPLTRLGDIEDPQAKEIDARFSAFDRMIRSGAAGICLKGKVPTDFVHHLYLCEGWDGRQGSSVATSGAALDKLPDELRDIADGRAKKK